LAPVGSYQANAFGLHDMGGNVAEICADDVTSGEFSPRVGDGLMGQAAEGRYRLVRGASWADDFGRARSGYREVTLKDRRTSMVGVRLARVVTE
jgi:formylglycine-generating enzyme required for sulfatase activity